VSTHDRAIIFPKDLLNKISFAVSDPKSRSILIHLSRKALKNSSLAPKITAQEIRSCVPGVSKIKEAEVLIEKLKRLSFLIEFGGDLVLGPPLMEFIIKDSRKQENLPSSPTSCQNKY